MRTPKSVSERRRSIRVEENVPFELKHESYSASTRTVNISATGILCLMDTAIPIMTKLKMTLNLPKFAKRTRGAVVRAEGVVVRKESDPITGKFHIAIFFSTIKPTDQRLITAFVEHRLHA